MRHGYIVEGEEKKYGIRRSAWIFRLALKQSGMCELWHELRDSKPVFAEVFLWE